jgi:hypothetical protein
MAKKQIEISTKRIAINNAQAQMVVIIAVASFITVFCLMASKAVLSQNQYNARVTTAKEKARDQLQDNIDKFSDLQSSYKAFNATATNVIGGTTTGTGDNDGDNSKIVLDALPSTYDFPALTSSLEKIFTDRNIKISSITGTDDQVAQQANLSSPKPTPVDIPFTLTISDANYQSVTQVIDTLQKSIRPIQIDSLDISGGSENMTVTITAHTYYQPAKSLSITEKVVK